MSQNYFLYKHYNTFIKENMYISETRESKYYLSVNNWDQL